MTPDDKRQRPALPDDEVTREFLERWVPDKADWPSLEPPAPPPDRPNRTDPDTGDQA